jgi:hypothetical protein
MSTGCSVCTHAQRDELEAALREGVSLRELEGQFHVSRSSLSRHASHTPDSVSPPPAAPPGAAAAVPLEPSQPLAAPGLAPAAVSPLPKTRLRACPVCLLPDAVFERLDTALGAQEPSQSLAQEFGMGMSDLLSHTLHRQSEALAAERYAREQARTAQAAAAMEAPPPASPAPLPWDELMRLAVQIHRQIEYGNSSAALVFSLRNVGKLLPPLIAAMAQACGQACPVPPGLLLPRFRPGDLPPHADWQMRGREEASRL